MSAHYCEGSIRIAFVLSVPGAAELNLGMPVSGQTGDNLDVALSHLNKALPQLFKSKQKYDYRITNAFAEPIARSLGHGSSEATNAKIREPDNVARVVRELECCDIVVLSGEKARLLQDHFAAVGRIVIAVPHVGNTGLNTSIKPPVKTAAKTSSARRLQRIEEWANRIKDEINAAYAG